MQYRRRSLNGRKLMDLTNMFAMDLQLLAEGSGAEGIEPTGDETTTEQIEIPEEHKEMFDKLLQAELAKKQAETDQAFAKMKAKQKRELETEREEASRLAKLSDDERKIAEFDKKVAALEAKEAALNERAMQAEIKNQLGLAGLPDSFLNTVYSDDAEKAQANIAALKEQFDNEINARVQKEVEAKFNGQKGPNVNTTTSTARKGSRITMRPLS